MRAVYHADVAHVGKRLKCSHCGFIVVIEKQQPSSPASRPYPDPPRPQTSKHSPDVPVKPKGSSLIFYGLSFLERPCLSPPQWQFGRGILLGSRVKQRNGVRWKVRCPSEAKVMKVTPKARKAQRTICLPVTHSVQYQWAAARLLQHRTTNPSHRHRRSQPKPRPSHYRSLPSGTRITEDSGVGGHGKLSVSNRTGVDAVVRLYDRYTLETVRWFFVKANASYAVKSIPQGDYVLAYTAGLDWVHSEDAFRWSPSYHEFEKPVSYSEQTDTTGTRYDEISVTLHPVIGGNVRTKSISRSDFLRGHRHVSF